MDTIQRGFVLDPGSPHYDEMPKPASTSGDSGTDSDPLAQRYVEDVGLFNHSRGKELCGERVPHHGVESTVGAVTEA